MNHGKRQKTKKELSEERRAKLEQKRILDAEKAERKLKMIEDSKKEYVNSIYSTCMVLTLSKLNLSNSYHSLKVDLIKYWRKFGIIE